MPARTPTDGRLRRAVGDMGVESGVKVVLLPGVLPLVLPFLCVSVGPPIRLHTAPNPAMPMNVANFALYPIPSRHLLRISSRLFHERLLRRSKGIMGLSGSPFQAGATGVRPYPIRSALGQSDCAARNRFGSSGHVSAYSPFWPARGAGHRNRPCPPSFTWPVAAARCYALFQVTPCSPAFSTV